MREPKLGADLHLPTLIGSFVSSAFWELPSSDLCVHLDRGCMSVLSSCLPPLCWHLCLQRQDGPVWRPDSGWWDPAVDNFLFQRLGLFSEGYQNEEKNFSLAVSTKWNASLQPLDFFPFCSPTLFMENESFDSFTHKWRGSLGINNTASWNAFACSPPGYSDLCYRSFRQ